MISIPYLNIKKTIPANWALLRFNFVFLYLIILASYPLMVFNSPYKWTVLNAVFYSSSSLLCLWCLSDIKKRSIAAWNIFGAIYFLGLWLDTLQMSALQGEKNAFDLYALVLGPLAFLYALAYSEKITIKPCHFSGLISLNALYVFFIVMYIGLSFYIASFVGWRLVVIKETHEIISGSHFVVPIFSGIWSTLGWTLVILAPHAKKRYAFLAIASVCLFSGVLHVKRGDFIRILMFIIIYLASSASFSVKNKKQTYLIVSLAILGVILFVCFGQWRLAQSGNGVDVVLNLTELKIKSVYLAWIFAYIAIQFDVFSLSAAAPSFTPSYQMEDLQTLFHPISSMGPILNDSLVPIKGFNAGTAFWSFVRDYGHLFFVELFVFWLIISLLLWCSKKVDCRGSCCFIYLLCGLMLFGNYFCNRSMVLAILFSNIVYFLSYNSRFVRSEGAS